MYAKLNFSGRLGRALRDVSTRLRRAQLHLVQLFVLWAAPLATLAYVLIHRFLPAGQVTGGLAAAILLLLGVLAGHLCGRGCRKAAPATVEELRTLLIPYLNHVARDVSDWAGLFERPGMYPPAVQREAVRRWGELHDRGYPKGPFPHGPAPVVMWASLGIAAAASLMALIFGYGLDASAATTLAHLEPDGVTLPMALLAMLAVWIGLTGLSLAAALVRPTESADWDDDPTLGDEIPEAGEEEPARVNRVFNHPRAPVNGVH